MPVISPTKKKKYSREGVNRSLKRQAHERGVSEGQLYGETEDELRKYRQKAEAKVFAKYGITRPAESKELSLRNLKAFERELAAAKKARGK